jgi:hypothetical protein
VRPCRTGASTGGRRRPRCCLRATAMSATRRRRRAPPTQLTGARAHGKPASRPRTLFARPAPPRAGQLLHLPHHTAPTAPCARATRPRAHPVPAAPGTGDPHLTRRLRVAPAPAARPSQHRQVHNHLRGRARHTRLPRRHLHSQGVAQTSLRPRTRPARHSTPRSARAPCLLELPESRQQRGTLQWAPPFGSQGSIPPRSGLEPLRAPTQTHPAPRPQLNPSAIAHPAAPSQSLQIAFPEPRLALVTASVGAFTGADASWCAAPRRSGRPGRWCPQ